MPRAVYSTRFLGSYQASPFTETATVPLGYVWVVKSASALLFGASAADLTVLIVGSGANVAYLAPSSAAAQQVTWNGMVVLEAGETIEAAGEGIVGCRYSISGYALTA